MTSEPMGSRRWASAARGLLVLWLVIALWRQYPVLIRQGVTDLVDRDRPLSGPFGSGEGLPGLVELVGRLVASGRGGRAPLLILPLPGEFEGDQGRFEELSLGPLAPALAHTLLQLAYQSFPQRVDVALVNSRGKLLRPSYRVAERFIPKVAVDLSQYEIVAMPRDFRLKLDWMQAVGQTPGGEFVIYRRSNVE